MGLVEEHVIGIDLGTMNSCVGVWRDNKVQIISDEYGERTTRSCVAFTDTGRLIGEPVLDQANTNAANTVFSKYSCYFYCLFVLM